MTTTTNTQALYELSSLSFDTKTRIAEIITDLLGEDWGVEFDTPDLDTFAVGLKNPDGELVYGYDFRVNLSDDCDEPGEIKMSIYFTNHGAIDFAALPERGQWLAGLSKLANAINTQGEIIKTYNAYITRGEQLRAQLKK